MTVSIRRMTLGSGYKYLMGSVAQSDGASQHASALTRYYAESGTPPGRFIGQGIAGLGNEVGIEVVLRNKRPDLPPSGKLAPMSGRTLVGNGTTWSTLAAGPPDA
jgi:hypothetical protein